MYFGSGLLLMGENGSLDDSIAKKNSEEHFQHKSEFNISECKCLNVNDVN